MYYTLSERATALCLVAELLALCAGYYVGEAFILSQRHFAILDMSCQKALPCRRR